MESLSRKWMTVLVLDHTFLKYRIHLLSSFRRETANGYMGGEHAILYGYQTQNLNAVQ